MRESDMVVVMELSLVSVVGGVVVCVWKFGDGSCGVTNVAYVR